MFLGFNVVFSSLPFIFSGIYGFDFYSFIYSNPVLAGKISFSMKTSGMFSEAVSQGGRCPAARFVTTIFLSLPFRQFHSVWKERKMELLLAFIFSW